MWMVRSALGTIGGRTLVVLIVLIVTYQIWIAAAAGGKVGDGVGDNPDRRGRFAVEVVLDFEPERFHVLELQEYGRIRATEGNVIHMRSVTSDGVDAMTRKYWISQIRPGGD